MAFLVRVSSGVLLLPDVARPATTCCTSSGCGVWLPEDLGFSGLTLYCGKPHPICGGGLVVTNFGRGIRSGDTDRIVSRPVLDVVAIAGPRISRSL